MRSLIGEPESLDSRYKQVGLTGITQYDLERESGVLSILETYHHYSFTVFPGSSVKSEVNYEFFVRPTIDWSLECDLNGKTRADTNNFSLKLKAHGPHPKSRGFAITALILALTMPLGGGGESGDFAASILVGSILSIPFTFGFLMKSTTSYYEWMQLLQEDLDNIDQAAWFNDCVDDLSKLDSNVIKAPLEGQMIRV